MFQVASNPCRHLKGDIIIPSEDRKTCSVKLSDLHAISLGMNSSEDLGSFEILH